VPVESRNYACTLALTSSSPRERGEEGVDVATGYARGEERLERELKGARVRREKKRELQDEARDAGRRPR